MRLKANQPLLLRAAMTETDFCLAFIRLGESGHCDGPNGMQYKRLLREWRDCGCPSDNLDRFIIRRANADADGLYQGEAP